MTDAWYREQWQLLDRGSLSYLINDCYRRGSVEAFHILKEVQDNLRHDKPMVIRPSDVSKIQLCQEIMILEKKRELIKANVINNQRECNQVDKELSEKIKQYKAMPL